LSSHSSCRRYLEDIDEARQAVGSDAPEIVAVRRFFNHPLFIAGAAHGLRAALEALGEDAHVVFTAHSIPISMSERCDYTAQFREASSLVAHAVSASSWSIAYQSRSGPPSQPWLEPDVLDELERLQCEGHACVAICPVGFVSDHMEVVWDLDVEARQKAEALGMKLARAKTAGMHPDFVAMVCELIDEQARGAQPRTLGRLGPRRTPCAVGCCPLPQRSAPGGGRGGGRP
jgi:ferrochelatase